MSYPALLLLTTLDQNLVSAAGIGSSSAAGNGGSILLDFIDIPSPSIESSAALGSGSVLIAHITVTPFQWLVPGDNQYVNETVSRIWQSGAAERIQESVTPSGVDALTSITSQEAFGQHYLFTEGVVPAVSYQLPSAFADVYYVETQQIRQHQISASVYVQGRIATDDINANSIASQEGFGQTSLVVPSAYSVTQDYLIAEGPADFYVNWKPERQFQVSGSGFLNTGLYAATAIICTGIISEEAVGNWAVYTDIFPGGIESEEHVSATRWVKSDAVGVPRIKRNVPLYSRPTAGARIAWNRKLTQGIVFACGYNGATSTGARQAVAPEVYAQDIVSPRAEPGVQFLSTMRGQWVGGPLGLGYHSNQWNTYWRQAGTPDTSAIGGRLDKIFLKWNEDLSIFFLATHMGNNGGLERYVCNVNTSGLFYHAYSFRMRGIPDDTEPSGRMRWYFGDSGNTPPTQPSEILNGDTIIQADPLRVRAFGLTRNKSAGYARLFLDGRPDGTTTTLADSTVPITLGSFLWARGPLQQSWDGTIYLMVIWRRALSDAEQMSLALSPWQVFQTPISRELLSQATGIFVQSILSEEGIGSPIHLGDITLSDGTGGIPSEEAVSTDHSIWAGDIAPLGIASQEGIPYQLSLLEEFSGIVLFVGITSEEAFEEGHIVEGLGVIYPVAIGSGEDFDNPDVGPPLGEINPFAIGQADTVGTPSVYFLTNPPLLASTGLLAKLCKPVELRHAEDFTNAPEDAAILPDVFGDFSEGGLRGPCPTVLISNSSPWIYLAACHPIKSIDKVYVDDQEATAAHSTSPAATPPPLEAAAASFYTQVAIISFTEQPAGVVTWRGKGRMEDDGTLITNPIRQLEILLRHRAGYSVDDFDQAALSEAMTVAEAAGYQTAWVFNDDRQAQEWITEVMFNVMGFWRVTGRERLALSLDPGGDLSDVVEAYIASRDCINGDDGVQMTFDRQNLINLMTAYYLYSWSNQAPSSRIITVDDNMSKNAYGEQRKAITLKGIRTQALLEQWGNILLERQSFRRRVEGAMVKFAIRDARAVHITVGDLISFSWPYGPVREEGKPYVNQILRVLSSSNEWEQGGLTTINAVDTGSYVRDGSGNRVLTPGVRS